jgi:poly(A) polymerase
MGRKAPPSSTGRAAESHHPPAPLRLPQPATPALLEVPRVERHHVVLDHARIDPDAQKVIHRLTRHGYEAYLVGGCVRDLLLGRRPKDFDVATSARPEDVRALFRNSRIIGRRFRLVHVLFGGGKVIEVATFRRTPTFDADPLDASAGPPADADLLIRSDNLFGEAHEDAVRRDFTINGLFYDLEHEQILDWVRGMSDVEQRVVRTIGDPEKRFLEDPVRILRAIKFAGRLDLGIDPDVYDAMVYTREALARAARPRLFEEILRLLRGGGAHRSVWLAWEAGLLAVLLPELATFLDDDGSAASRVFRLLGEIDRRTVERRAPLDDVVLFALLLLEPMKEACESDRDRISAAFAFLDPVIERLAVPRRIADAVRRIVAVLPRLTAGRAGRFARTTLYEPAAEIVEIDRIARG